VGATVLVAGLVAWLSWPPPEEDPPGELVGWPRRVTNEPTAGLQSNEPGVGAPSESAPTGVTNLAPTLPQGLLNQLGSTSGPPARFKPSPNLIAPATPGHAWPARPVETIREAQIVLARMAISPGSIDGLNGPKTRAALRAFQSRQRLRPTGELDPPTRARLLLTEPPYTHHIVTSQELARLMPVPQSWIEKSRLPRLDYETLLELVGERWQADPEFIRQLNQDLDWEQIPAGTSLIVPQVRPPAATERAAFVRISLANRTLQVFDRSTNLMAHFPCSIARQVQDRLSGALRVVRIVPDPIYTFDPVRFPRTPEARAVEGKLTIPAGPNNPVGVAWVELDRAGYGIHGTPEPERVGQAESLGCFRLANWNVELLTRLAWEGMPVRVDP
jgi:lipoprotein-anchoring transpeptidase ErfK/SrfK